MKKCKIFSKALLIDHIDSEGGIGLCGADMERIIDEITQKGYEIINIQLVPNVQHLLIYCYGDPTLED